MKNENNKKRLEIINLINLNNQDDYKINNNILKTNEIVVYLKKSLKIIHNYDKIGKKILFVGIPYGTQRNFKKRLKLIKKHMFVDRRVFTSNKLTSNYEAVEKDEYLGVSLKKQISRFLLLEKRPDLVILFGSNLKIDSSYLGVIKKKIPAICISPQFLKKVGMYKIPYSSNFLKSFNNVVFSLIVAVLLKKNGRIKV